MNILCIGGCFDGEFTTAPISSRRATLWKGHLPSFRQIPGTLGTSIADFESCLREEYSEYRLEEIRLPHGPFFLWVETSLDILQALVKLTDHYSTKSPYLFRKKRIDAPTWGDSTHEN